MSTQAHEIFTPARVDAPAGCDRHSGADALCERLARVLLGRGAETLLDAGLDEVDAAVFRLPSWSWADPLISVGRKALAADGGTLRMPVRISWSLGPVVVVPVGGRVKVSWEAHGLGRSGDGSVVLVTTPGHGDMSAEDFAVLDGPIPSRSYGVVYPANRVRLELEELAADGKAAWWELLTDLEYFVRQEVGSAAARVAAEINGDGADFTLDPVMLESITTQMMFGSEEATGNAGKGRVIAMLERALRPKEFSHVEPTRWVRTTLSREAEAAVRRRIGDPHVGRKIRSLMREIGPDGFADVASFLAHYKERYPYDDDLGLERTTQALMMSAAPLLSISYLEEGSGTEVPVEMDLTAALDHIERQRLARRDGGRDADSA